MPLHAAADAGEATGQRVTVWYEEEDDKGEAVDVAYVGTVMSVEYADRARPEPSLSSS